jgi:hypothetical protein
MGELVWSKATPAPRSNAESAFACIHISGIDGTQSPGGNSWIIFSDARRAMRLARPFDKL